MNPTRNLIRRSQTLQHLHEAGLRTAVVTNKHERFASGLLNRLDLTRWVDVVVGGDTCERRKPDPQPLLFACGKMSVPASRALMVGDSINDVKAARAAGMPIVCVPYGYNEGQDPRSLECDVMIETLATFLLAVGRTMSPAPVQSAMCVRFKVDIGRAKAGFSYNRSVCGVSAHLP